MDVIVGVRLALDLPVGRLRWLPRSGQNVNAALVLDTINITLYMMAVFCAFYTFIPFLVTLTNLKVSTASNVSKHSKLYVKKKIKKYFQFEHSLVRLAFAVLHTQCIKPVVYYMYNALLDLFAIFRADNLLIFVSKRTVDECVKLD